jgi:hypothetical protein
MALELDVVVEEELLEETGALPRVLPPPKRLVAAVNAEDAFGAVVATDEFELEPDELVEEDEFEFAELGVEEELSRPRPLRLPMSRGVISDT